MKISAFSILDSLFKTTFIEFLSSTNEAAAGAAWTAADLAARAGAGAGAETGAETGAEKELPAVLVLAAPALAVKAFGGPLAAKVAAATTAFVSFSGFTLSPLFFLLKSTPKLSSINCSNALDSLSANPEISEPGALNVLQLLQIRRKSLSTASILV